MTEYNRMRQYLEGLVGSTDIIPEHVYTMRISEYHLQRGFTMSLLTPDLYIFKQHYNIADVPFKRFVTN